VPVPDPEPSQPAGTVLPEVFKRAFRRHAAGVAVVTADVGDGPLAITVSSLTSVSADPAILLFSISGSTETGRAMARADTAVVHLLDADDHDLAVRCAEPGRARFDDTVAWELLATGEPTFTAPRVRLRCRTIQRSAFGGSTVLVLAVEDVLERAVPAGEEPPGPLAYHDRAWHVLGHRSRLG